MRDSNDFKRIKKAFVYTCAYNAEKTIARTIESVLNQTFKDFDYFIVNNGSTDSTGDIILNYAASDNRLYMIQINVNDLRNSRTLVQALSYSSGAKYGARIDADDVMHNDYLETMINYADENDLDIVACGYNKIDGETGKLLSVKQCDENFIIEGEKFKDEFIKYRGFTIYSWGKLSNLDLSKKYINTNRLKFRASVNGEKLSSIKDKIYQATDSTETLEVIKLAKRFGVVGKPLMDYYIYKNALSYSLTENMYDSYMKLYVNTREFIESKGSLSSENENFLHCIYLSILNEFSARIFELKNMANADKYKALHSILANNYTKESFSFAADPKFRNLATRVQWLNDLTIKLNRFSAEYSEANELIKLVEELKVSIPKL